VGELLVIVGVAEHLEEAFLVANIFELWVCSCHVAVVDELNHSRLRKAVEICAQQELNSLRTLLVSWSEAVAEIFHDLSELSISIMDWISLTSQNSGSQWM